MAYRLRRFVLGRSGAYARTFTREVAVEALDLRLPRMEPSHHGLSERVVRLDVGMRGGDILRRRDRRRRRCRKHQCRQERRASSHSTASVARSHRRPLSRPFLHAPCGTRTRPTGLKSGALPDELTGLAGDSVAYGHCRRAKIGRSGLLRWAFGGGDAQHVLDARELDARTPGGFAEGALVAVDRFPARVRHEVRLTGAQKRLHRARIR